MKNFKFSSLLLAPLFAVLAACGGGGGDDAPSTPAVATLKSITVSAPSTTIPIGTNQTMVATGTYSDGSSKVLTTAGGLAWTTKSGGATVAQVFSSGIVTGKSVGTETINATQENIVGSLAVTITSPWTMVSAGGYQTIARKADGNLYSWGSNIQGQLGDSSNSDRNAPVVVNAGAGNTTWRMVAVGDQFAVAIRTSGTITTSGTLWAWGLNQNGQLGDGTTVSKSVPVQIGKDTDWAFVAAGKGHAMAIKTNGILYGWGRNFSGQLGDGTVISRSAPTKIGVATWQTVSAGETHTLGLQKDGSLWAWGGGESGQIGNAASTASVPAPVKIGTSTWASVSAGAFHSMGVRADGTLWAWGANGTSQLGDNGTASANAPKAIASDIKNWTVVAAGANHTMGVRSDGTLWGWGSNTEGQLGNGDTDSSFPVQIGTGTTWVTVTSGAAHSFALKTDNTLWGWGRNQEGQLGNGKNVLSPIPVNVPN